MKFRLPAAAALLVLGLAAARARGNVRGRPCKLKSNAKVALATTCLPRKVIPFQKCAQHLESLAPPSIAMSKRSNQQSNAKK